MKTMMCVLMFGFVTILGAPGRVAADVHKGAPKEAMVLPDDGTGVTKVVFLFDLSGLREGGNRRIEEALLDWRLTGVEADEMPAFAAYPVMTAWTKAAVQGGSAPSIEATMASDWQVNPLTPETEAGKLVRLDLTELVGNWASGARANYGFIVAVPGLSSKVLADQLAKAELTIRYGFRDN